MPVDAWLKPVEGFVVEVKAEFCRWPFVLVVRGAVTVSVGAVSVTESPVAVAVRCDVLEKGALRWEESKESDPRAAHSSEVTHAHFKLNRRSLSKDRLRGAWKIAKGVRPNPPCPSCPQLSTPHT